MYDVVNSKVQYTVADYVKDANRVIGKIRERGKLPIIVGGTGLYLKALLEGLSNLEIPIDKKLRKKLERSTKEQLQEKVKEISFKRWEKLNPSDRENPRRLIRAIELEVSKGDQGGSEVRGLEKEFKILKIGLTAPRQILYKRVDERLVSRMKQGMLDEAERLHRSGLSLKRMKQLGLEYGVLADYLKSVIGDIRGDRGLIKTLQNKIHGYLRRQLTWFKKDKNVFWYDIENEDFSAKVEKAVAKWYHQAHATKG